MYSIFSYANAASQQQAANTSWWTDFVGGLKDITGVIQSGANIYSQIKGAEQGILYTRNPDGSITPAPYLAQSLGLSNNMIWILLGVGAFVLILLLMR